MTIRGEEVLDCLSKIPEYRKAVVSRITVGFRTKDLRDEYLCTLDRRGCAKLRTTSEINIVQVLRNALQTSCLVRTAS